MAIIRREQTELEKINLAMEQPTGFPNQTDSEILYDEISRQITLQPKAPATQFSYYIKGEEHIVTTPQQLTHPDTTGLYYFYWDSSNVLHFSTTVWDILVDVQEPKAKIEARIRAKNLKNSMKVGVYVYKIDFDQALLKGMGREVVIFASRFKIRELFDKIQKQLKK